MRHMITYDESFQVFEELRKRFYFCREAEMVCINESLGRILAEDIYSNENLPKHNLSTMDGFAVRSFDDPPLKIVGEVFPDTNCNAEIKERETFYITTGAPLPEGADAVLKVELAEVNDGMLYFNERLKPGKYVLKKGSEIKKGELIIEKGRRIGPQEIAVLTGLGIERVKVLRKLRIAVFSNGDEIKKGILKDTNSAMIMSFIREWGEEPHFLGVAGDSYDEVREMILNCVKNYDIAITSGGVSVGKKDFVVKVLKDEGEMILYKVKQRPGKPMAVGIVKNKPVFAFQENQAELLLQCSR